MKGHDMATGSSPDVSSTPLVSGLDLSGYDRSVRPQDDLFRFVNGQWLRTTAIPPDRSNYGAFTSLDDQAQADLRALIEEAASAPQREQGSDAQKVGDFYRAFMDTESIDALGLQPLEGERERIRRLQDLADV